MSWDWGEVSLSNTSIPPPPFSHLMMVSFSVCPLKNDVNLDGGGTYQGLYLSLIFQVGIVQSLFYYKIIMQSLFLQPVHLT